jgi:putative colanic acid biosynthesis acetyltransferase WcaF
MPLQRLDQFKLPPGFRGRPGWYVQLWWIIQAVFFNTSPQFLYGWRRFLLRCFGAKIGRGVIIRPSVHTQFPWKVTIGDYSWIGDQVILYSLGNIIIGKHVVISQKTYLCAGTHNYKDPHFAIDNPSVVVEDECWLATDVFVAPGVQIGAGTVVGARSSVFKSLPPGKVCNGSPAVCIKDRL